MWEIEEIPDTSNVFTRIHKHNVSSQDGKPKKTAFQNTPQEGDDLSCDWNKYYNETQSMEQIGKEKNVKGNFKNKWDFYIWSFSVEKLRKIESPKQNVLHRPIYNNPEIPGIPNNRAHSGIFGSKPINDAKFRTKLLRSGVWSTICPPEDEELRMIDSFIQKSIFLSCKEIIIQCDNLVDGKPNLDKSKYLNFINSFKKLLTGNYKPGSISPELLQKSEPIIDELIRKQEIEDNVKDMLYK